MRRVEAGEQTAVRWQRERRHRFDPIEDDSFARKPIEHRRCRARVSIQAETIGSRGIERDEDDVLWRGIVTSCNHQRPPPGRGATLPPAASWCTKCAPFASAFCLGLAPQGDEVIRVATIPGRGPSPGVLVPEDQVPIHPCPDFGSSHSSHHRAVEFEPLGRTQVVDRSALLQPPYSVSPMKKNRSEEPKSCRSSHPDCALRELGCSSRP